VKYFRIFDERSHAAGGVVLSLQILHRNI